MIYLAISAVILGIMLLGWLLMYEQSQQRRSEAVKRLNQAIELDWRRKWDYPATEAELEELRVSTWQD